jgi:hypothetical protein
MSTRLQTAALVITLMGSLTLLGTPSFAVEPDTDSPAGPELPAPRTDRPDFQQDDQTGVAIDPQAEGADPRPPAAYVAPDVVITEPAPPVPR